MKKNIIIAVLSVLLIISIVSIPVIASRSNTSVNTQDANYASTSNSVVRVYYLTEEYQTGKHQIVKVWGSILGTPPPEDNPDTAINVPYGVIEFDYQYNKALAKDLFTNTVNSPDGGVYDKYYVNANLKICKRNGTVVSIAENPNKVSYKLNELANMTQSEIEAYIDKNVTTLAQAKAFLKKLSAVVLYLVKQSELGD